jgi:hypothetical protein
MGQIGRRAVMVDLSTRARYHEAAVPGVLAACRKNQTYRGLVRRVWVESLHNRDQTTMKEDVVGTILVDQTWIAVS